jgi:tetratricopeptide (TPR) repeat protein
VTKKEIQQYKASLHKTFGRLFLAQNRPETHKKALEELSQGIFLECQEHGPESIYLCSSYFYMGELFRKEESIQRAKSFYQKIIQIWKNFIIDSDLPSDQDPTTSVIDQYYYLEAIQQVAVIKNYLENELGHENIATAESSLAYGLISLKIGQIDGCIEGLRMALGIYQNQLGEFDFKTKEVENLLRQFEQYN